jgi:hypothetical protein
MQASVKHRAAASATPETATSKLVCIGCEIVAAEGGRNVRNWHAGVEIKLRDGRWMHSNTREFRAVLSAEFARRYGCQPSRGAVTQALRLLNHQRFKNRKSPE